MNRVIVGLEKFRQNIDISVGMFMCKIFVESIANPAKHTFSDRTFEVGVPAHLKLNALVLLHVLKMFN